MSEENITGKCCNKLHKISYKLSINCNISFGSCLQQVTGTSYGKLQEKVTSCYNNLQEQTTSFLQALCKSYRRSDCIASYRKKWKTTTRKLQQVTWSE